MKHVLKVTALALLFLMPVVPAGAGSGEGEQALRRYMAGAGLERAFSRAEIGRPMKGRYEIRIQTGGYAMAAVAVPLAGARSGPATARLMCNAALLRPLITVRVQTMRQQNQPEGLISAYSGLAVKQARISSVKHSRPVSGGRWICLHCRAPLAAMEQAASDLGNLSLVPRAAYLAARQAVTAGREREALELLKRTGQDPVVFGDALGYIIPLLTSRNPEAAKGLESRYLNIDTMTDARAVAFLARFMMDAGRYGMVARLCDRCLSIDPGNTDCDRMWYAAQSWSPKDDGPGGLSWREMIAD